MEKPICSSNNTLQQRACRNVVTLEACQQFFKWEPLFPFKSLIFQGVAESALSERELILAVSGAFIQSCISKTVLSFFKKKPKTLKPLTHNMDGCLLEWWGEKWAQDTKITSKKIFWKITSKTSTMSFFFPANSS